MLATRGSVQGQSINARPTLTINKLPQHVRQVTNDQRQNRPSGKVIPADDKGDVEVAEIFDGIVRHIEYSSDADVAYDTACENQVAYGEGYIRILTEYTDPTSFDQDIKIGRVRNSFSVYMDPMIQDRAAPDAQWCFVTEDIPKDEYERQFPTRNPSLASGPGVGDQSVSQWVNDETVRVADYYYIEHTKKTLNLYYGNVSALSGSPEDKQMVALGMKPIRSREVDIKQVKYCKINGFEVLERNDWAGSHIPVVRVIGNEFEVDGRLYLSGHRPQCQGRPAHVQLLDLSGGRDAGAGTQSAVHRVWWAVRGYENQWKTANTTNWPYLEVNPDVTDGQGGTYHYPSGLSPDGPERADSGQDGRVRRHQGCHRAVRQQPWSDLQRAQRQGDPRPRASGRHRHLPLRRQPGALGAPCDPATGGPDPEDLRHPAHRPDHRRGRHFGHGSVNPDQQEPVKKIVNEQGIVIQKVYNLGVGKYDVCVTTGPSYMTKRQESLNAMTELLQGNPELWAVAGDLFIRTWTGRVPRRWQSGLPRPSIPSCSVTRTSLPRCRPRSSRCRPWRRRWSRCTRCCRTCRSRSRTATLRFRNSSRRSRRLTLKPSGFQQFRPV
ncbi:MAG: hypothetical protein IPG23_17540 [Burkholderiales bacterium]|nr:hypothetical protein [Burkholderiales bacterium]